MKVKLNPATITAIQFVPENAAEITNTFKGLNFRATQMTNYTDDQPDQLILSNSKTHETYVARTGEYIVMSGSDIIIVLAEKAFNALFVADE